MAAQEEEKLAGDVYVPPAILARKNNQFLVEMKETAKKIATPGRGILAADESTGTIGKRFAAINVENNEENRRKYRELLFTTDGLEEYISGVIMFEETLFANAADGKQLVDILIKKGIVPGIKVDKGTRQLPYKPNETYTQGLTDLDLRAKKYYTQGARFAKWRAVCRIQNGVVSQTAIDETAWTLARYAAICQANGLVPIVEPELLMDGNHSLEVCQYWTEKIVAACYKALSDQEVVLEATLLKPNMCLPGSDYTGSKTIVANATATREMLLRCVPAAVPAITFLSGGQSEEEATLHLNEINKAENQNKSANLPWSATFSFGRALQQSCLKAWQGNDANIKAAQDALLTRARANYAAVCGEYDGFAATEESKQSLMVKNYVY